MGRLGIDNESLFIGGGAVAVVAGGFFLLTEHFKEVDTINQENPEYSMVIENSTATTVDGSIEVGGRIVHSKDCAIDENGKILGIYSGDERISAPVNEGSLTIEFSKETLPDAVPDALGHCDVTIQDAQGKIVDTYQVNAYKPAMLQFFAN